MFPKSLFFKILSLSSVVVFMVILSVTWATVFDVHTYAGFTPTATATSVSDTPVPPTNTPVPPTEVPTLAPVTPIPTTAVEEEEEGGGDDNGSDDGVYYIPPEPDLSQPISSEAPAPPTIVPTEPPAVSAPASLSVKAVAPPVILPVTGSKVAMTSLMYMFGGFCLIFIGLFWQTKHKKNVY